MRLAHPFGASLSFTTRFPRAAPWAIAARPFGATPEPDCLPGIRDGQERHKSRRRAGEPTCRVRPLGRFRSAIVHFQSAVPQAQKRARHRGLPSNGPFLIPGLVTGSSWYPTCTSDPRGMAGSFQGKFLDRCRKSFRHKNIGRQKVFLSRAAYYAIGGEVVAVAMDGTPGQRMALGTISCHTRNRGTPYAIRHGIAYGVPGITVPAEWLRKD